MKILPYEKIAKLLWDSLVEESDDAWLYSTSRYIDYAIRSGNISRCFGVFSDSNELLGVFPLYMHEGTADNSLRPTVIKKLINTGTNKLFHKKLFPQSGISKQSYFFTGYSNFALINTMRERGRKSVLKIMLQYIDESAKQENIHQLKIRLVDIAPRYMPPLRKYFNPLWQVGIHEHLVEPPRLVAIISLSKSIEELENEMDQDCRSGISKAKRLGLDFIKGDYGDLGTYWMLHHETWSRTGMNPHSLEEIQDEWNVLAKESHLFFCRHKKEVIAAVLLHAYKTGVLYWGGCSRFDAQILRGNNFLLWSCIKWAKEKGYLWFNIGLFQPTPGGNLKEYNVGKYKSQFTKDYYEAYESQKSYLDVH